MSYDSKNARECLSTRGKYYDLHVLVYRCCYGVLVQQELKGSEP